MNSPWKKETIYNQLHLLFHSHLNSKATTGSRCEEAIQDIGVFQTLKPTCKYQPGSKSLQFENTT